MNEQRSTPPGGAAPLRPARTDWQALPAELIARHAELGLIERALDANSDCCCVLDHDWRILYLNRSAVHLAATLGLDGAALPGKILWEEMPGLPATASGALLQEAMQERRELRREAWFAPFGRWLEVHAAPCADGLAVWVRDCTVARARLEGALRAALNGAGIGEWCWDGASDRFDLGQRAAALFAVPAHVPIGWDELRRRVLDVDRTMLRTEFQRALRERGPLAVECRVHGRHGEHRWIGIYGHASPGGEAMTGVVQDIGERKHAEDALRQSEEALRALADSIPQLAWMANADGYIVWYNQRWYHYTGKSREDMLGWGWQSVQDPEVVPIMMARWRASLRSGEPFEMEFPIRGADGQFRWFLTRVNPVRDARGHVLRWFGTSTDVDQVKRVEQALRDESQVLELLNETGATLATQRDLRSLLQTVCDAATRISGARVGAFFYRGRGAPGVAYTGLADDEPDLDAKLGALGALVEADCPQRVDDTRAAGAPAVPHLHPPVRSFLAVPVTARSGEQLGCLFLGHPAPAQFNARSERIVAGIAAQAAVAIDNTRLYEAAQHAAEERKVLLENERLMRAEAERASQMKDEFLATLSHELRTPLSSILGWAQVLRRGSRGQEDLNKGLQTIERNARAQAQLIEDLLDMSRITSGKVLLDMQVIGAPMFVDAAIETLRPAFDAKAIRVVRRYDPHAGQIAGDPARLQQVVWNLLSNAIKFTPRDGTVTVCIEPAPGHVCIRVSDTGLGIKPEFLPHVFERFRQADASTTRRHGGLGLGLSIVKHLVEQHGGTVRVESEGEGHGATFTLELPLAQAQAVAERGARTPALPRKTRAPEMQTRDLSGVHVLVVDDERDARELIRRVLSECDASVTLAANAAEALELIQADPPDVLISDLGMPDMDGFELLGRVRALGPAAGGNVPAVALTAFARSEDRVKALENGFWAHIAKPVEPSELIAAVATIVNRA
ncbi:MAG: ATP-binding protein [Telluria sp.]